MTLVIDNFDSFTYNIVQYLKMLGEEVLVKRNLSVDHNNVMKLGADRLIISPGPSHPSNTGNCLKIVKHCAGKLPIFGICLGLQTIAQAFGGKIVLAKEIYHGRASTIYHQNKGVFKSLPSPYRAIRYHSLVVDKNFPTEHFVVTAYSENNEIMGLMHKKYLLEGIQFHPESIGTEYGMEILKNFLTKN